MRGGGMRWLPLLFLLAGCADANAPPVAPQAYDVAVAGSSWLAAYPDDTAPAGIADRAGFKALYTTDGAAAEAAMQAAQAYDSSALLIWLAQDLPQPVDPARLPATIRLLDRLRATLDPIVGTAKHDFARPRPFRVLELAQTCDPKFSPAAGPDVGLQDSYPSGHAARGWSAALVMARVDPAHGAQWLARGRLFGQARITCGVHWPSDVAAGQLLATALVARLQSDVAFRHDLDAARTEFSAAGEP